MPIPKEKQELISQLREQLWQRRAELMNQEVSTRTNLDEQIMTSPGDDADSSVIDSSADYFLRLANEHRRELLEIQDALDRMQKGTYGICESCELDIAPERLKRIPYARLCIECQASAEKEASHGGGPHPRL